MGSCWGHMKKVLQLAKRGPSRAPLALGEGWGDRTVDPLFAVLKSPATGGKRSASATLTPALAKLVGSRSPSRFASSSFPPGTRSAGSTPGSLGGTSPATSRRERRRARALGVPYAQTLETVELSDERFGTYR